MYSVILMAALSASGPDAAAFCHRGGGGCYSAACYGCYGYGCGGYGCGGEWAGGPRLSGYYWGGYHGYGMYGTYGQVAYGQYGCEGYHGYVSYWNTCYGGTACYGGCYGSCLGCYAHTAGCYGGCYGQPIWYGPMVPYHPSGNPMTAPSPAPPPEKKPETKPATHGGAAKLIIDMPIGAKLFVDDQPIKVTSAAGEFETPMLEPGQTYYYTFRVESVRDGKAITESRRVYVRAGELIRESFVGRKGDAIVQK